MSEEERMSDEKETGKPVQRGPNGAVDPTANVLALVEAAVKRLNDLQDASTLRIEDLRELDNKRLDDLRRAENRRIDEQALLRAEYQEKLSMAESKRIDAIRAVDVAAVAVSSERATAQATVLANQVATSADALRTLVASTSTTLATQQQAVVNALSERLTILERSNYEGKGRSTFADPQLEELAKEMKSLRESRSEVTGKGQGISLVWTVFLGGIAAISILYAMYTSSTKPATVVIPAPQTQQPQLQPAAPGTPVVVGQPQK